MSVNINGETKGYPCGNGGFPEIKDNCEGKKSLLCKNIHTAISQYSMIVPGDTVMIALSGGADSVALLQAMIALSGELGIKIKACHLNHNLRGDESKRDEYFVRDFCRRFDVPLIVKSIDVRLHKQKHQSIEEAARNARYVFFKEAASAEKMTPQSSFKIATAHNANDNVETVLFNLTRGSVLKGLCGIPPVRGNIIRPMILCERVEVENYCHENKLDYVTDSTNLSDEYTRNRIRMGIVPLLEGINPQLMAGISRMTHELRQDEEFIFSFAFEIKEKAREGDKYRVDVLNTTPETVLNRIIAAVLSQNNISPSSLMICGIKKILTVGKGKINIKKNAFAVVKKGFFYLERCEQNYKNRTL